MKTSVTVSPRYVALVALTALGIGGATLARLANSSDAGPSAQILNYVSAPVVDLIIKESTDPTEANQGVHVDWHKGNDPNSATFPAPIPTSFAPGRLTIKTTQQGVIYGDLNWSIPANLRVWWNQNGNWEPVSNRAGYPTSLTEELYVQGIAPGAGRIVVTFTPETEATAAADDTIKTTVAELEPALNPTNDNQNKPPRGK